MSPNCRGVQSSMGSRAFTSVPVVFGLTLVAVIAGGYLEPSTRSHEVLLHTPDGPARIRASLATDDRSASNQTPARYLVLDPPFIFTMQQDQERRYLELHITLGARNEEAMSVVQRHLPLIRAAVDDVLYGRDYKSFEGRAGKEALRAECLAAARSVMTRETGGPAIDDLYFTDLLFQ